jgi:hypothetical protein
VADLENDSAFAGDILFRYSEIHCNGDATLLLFGNTGKGLIPDF